MLGESPAGTTMRILGKILLAAMATWALAPGRRTFTPPYLPISSTDATRFVATTSTIQDGLTANLTGFRPAQPVHEASSLAPGLIVVAVAVRYGLHRRLSVGTD